MSRALTLTAMALLCSNVAQGAPYTIRTDPVAIPKDVSPAVARELSDQCIELLDSKSKVLAQLWLRKTVPAKAATGGPFTYRDLEETTLLGAVRFPADVRDYRNQKIRAGVYTLRLGFQPMDGDHMGTAPFSEFCLLVGAANDKSPDLIKDPKDLYERSGKSVHHTHAGVLLLFPVEKRSPSPKLVNKGQGQWVVTAEEKASAAGNVGILGIALTLVGHSMSQ